MAVLLIGGGTLAWKSMISKIPAQAEADTINLIGNSAPAKTTRTTAPSTKAAPNPDGRDDSAARDHQNSRPADAPASVSWEALLGAQ